MGTKTRQERANGSSAPNNFFSHLGVSQAKHQGSVLHRTRSFSLSPPPAACPMQNSILGGCWDTLPFQR
ncbi:hypothetical protein PILCRDRAFT_830217 [Piloderma croceum F 1598]|uniref:Uncharacterized protein n=1 Tax=Piloderma croceum (strain F 1598) TaxID=765440 RepID=A0A0C3EGA0_PILCF|nr:hypothetical protein PILCRDRAFT_830217 [Piloderma croceum F 1598]